VDAGVVDARFIRPLDVGLLKAQAASARVFATVENAVAAGGFGSAVQEALAEMNSAARVIRVGWPDEFVPQGTTAVLTARYGLTAESLAERVAAALTMQHAN
jgi:1-deoxy-D-xylulose-5-phosphate synthase